MGVGVGMGVGDGSAVAVGSLGVGSAVGAAAEEHASPVTTKTSSAKIRSVRIRDLQGDECLATLVTLGSFTSMVTD